MRSIVPHKSLVLFILTFLFVAESCTIHKRIHRKGWFVQWHITQRQNGKQCKGDTSTLLSTGGEAGLRMPQPSRVEQLSNAEAFEARDSENKIDVSTKHIVLNDDSLQLSKHPLHVQDWVDAETNQNKRGLSQISYSGLKMKSISPTRVPALAWALLFLGVLLVAIALILGIIYFVISGSLIGAPLYLGVMLIGGVVLLVLATRTALASMNRQPSSPDPRYEREEPKREKKEREPLTKNDKIFLAIIGGFALAIGILLLAF